MRGILRKNQGNYAFLVAQRKDGSLAGGLVGVLEAHVFCDLPVATLVFYEVERAARMSGAAIAYCLLFANGQKAGRQWS
ncbi:hypothetical protein V8J88_15565 [Massilia sp. W12]|uniref:hypothetical protein n=1 Tax=Massilia sp. W12 TaxID=3126507 RepID=UPI0030CF3D92